MSKSFRIWPLTDTGAAIRFAAVVLLAANLVMLYLVVRPPGGSAQELRQQVADARIQLRQRTGSVQRTR